MTGEDPAKHWLTSCSSTSSALKSFTPRAFSKPLAFSLARPTNKRTPGLSLGDTIPPGPGLSRWRHLNWSWFPGVDFGVAMVKSWRRTGGTGGTAISELGQAECLIMFDHVWSPKEKMHHLSASVPNFQEEHWQFIVISWGFSRQKKIGNRPGSRGSAIAGTSNTRSGSGLRGKTIRSMTPSLARLPQLSMMIHLEKRGCPTNCFNGPWFRYISISMVTNRVGEWIELGLSIKELWRIVGLYNLCNNHYQSRQNTGSHVAHPSIQPPS